MLMRRIRALEAEVDVADDEPFIVTQVEERRGVLLAGMASRGGEQQNRTEGAARRDAQATGRLVDPAIERRDEVLDYPHAERCLAELSAQRGYPRPANMSQDVSRAHSSTRFRSKRQHPDERNAVDSPHHGPYSDQGADGEHNSDHADTS